MLIREQPFRPINDDDMKEDEAAKHSPEGDSDCYRLDGIPVSSSSQKRRKRFRRSMVSARSMPWASSSTVRTEMAIPLVPGFLGHGFEKLAGVHALAFGGDSGRRVASIPSGRLQRLPLDSDGCFDILCEIGIDSRGGVRRHRRKIHSEILRRTGSARRMTATGRASRSMMTSPPVSTHCRIDHTS